MEFITSIPKKLTERQIMVNKCDNVMNEELYLGTPLIEKRIKEEESNLNILKESGLIGCISAEPDFSTNYKSILRQELNNKYS